MGQQRSRVVSSSALLNGSHPVTIRAISVASIQPNSSLEIHDTTDGSGNAIFIVDGTENACHAPLEIRVRYLYAKINGPAVYNVVWD